MRTNKDDRKSKDLKEQIDLSQPLNLDHFKLSDDDCFGRSYKPQHSECAACSSIEVCGIVFQNIYLKDREKAVKKSRGINFLDEVNFNRIDKVKLLERIKEDSGNIKLDEIIIYIKHYSKCDDQTTIVTWLKEFKEENNLSIKSGIVYYGK